MGEGGVPKRDFYDMKFGKDKWHQLVDRMQETFKQAGLPPMTMEGTIGPTRDSHRLIALAESQSLEVQDSLVESLFRRYFVEGQNVCTDREVLAQAAAEAGLEGGPELARDPEAGTDLVEKELETSRDLGVTAVPFFLFQGPEGSTSFSGAQPVPAFEDAFRRVSGSASS